MNAGAKVIQTMRRILTLVMFLSVQAFGEEYPPCNFLKSKKVAFTSAEKEDLLTVSAIGSPCYKGTLKITLSNSSGEILHHYERSLGQGDSKQPGYDKIIENYVNHLISSAIGNSSELPEQFACEVEGPSCKPYESNTVPMEKYTLIRNKKIPTISHQIGYESWATWVFDKQQGKVVKVLEGGL